MSNLSIVNNYSNSNNQTAEKVCIYSQLFLEPNSNHSDDNENFFDFDGIKMYLLEFITIISSVALIISFVVYALLPQLRTIPGKCLMGLIISELFTNCLYLIGLKQKFSAGSNGCIAVAILLHYFFLTTFSWTNLIGKCFWPNLKHLNYNSTIIKR